MCQYKNICIIRTFPTYVCCVCVCVCVILVGRYSILLGWARRLATPYVRTESKSVGTPYGYGERSTVSVRFGAPYGYYFIFIFVFYLFISNFGFWKITKSKNL